MPQRTPDAGRSGIRARHILLLTVLAALALAALPSCGSKKTPPALSAAQRQHDAAAALGIPKELVLEIDGNVKMRLALIPAGKFLMGSPPDEKDRWDNDQTPHEVTIPKAFYMGIFPVTQEQWKAVVGTEPWKYKTGEDIWKVYDYVMERPDCPASHIYEDAADFCAALSLMMGRTVRLPTEAEREYACRAGSTTRFPYGDDPNCSLLGDYAWYRKNSWAVGEDYAHPVGRKRPNDWGLYDMLGNVWELCWNCNEGYKGLPPIVLGDPNAGAILWQGDSSAAVMWRGNASGPVAWRGNSYFYVAEGCRSAARCDGPILNYPAGFRVMVTLDPYVPPDPTPTNLPSAEANKADKGNDDNWRPETTPKAIVWAVESSNAFAADLYPRLAVKEKGNLFFSPGSIEMAMAMPYAGATGDTASQMAKVLHFNLPPDELQAGFGRLLERLNHPLDKGGRKAGGQRWALNTVDPNRPAYQLVVANALWGRKGWQIKPSFVDRLRKNYGAALSEVDFAQEEQAAKTINDWVAGQTKGKIKELIQRGDLKPETLFALTNAIYFKSGWAEVFRKEDTKDGPFTLAGGESVTVPMMHVFKEVVFYQENDQLQMLELPYSCAELSMLVFLPKKGVALEAVEKTLMAGGLEKWRLDESNEDCQYPANVTLPRFAFSSRLALPDVLREMGMADAFNPDKADFSGIPAAGSPAGKPLFLDAVIHEAVISVDEEGTEAAAATVVDGVFGASEPKVFKADHPFVFLIRHNATGAVLFMGRVANPK